MLRSLTNPSQIGPGMAVALITTFYGAMMANLLFLPLAGKLETLSQQEILLKDLAIEGILAIQAGDSPHSGAETAGLPGPSSPGGDKKKENGGGRR